MYPAICINEGDRVYVNFGQKSFKFNLDPYVKCGEEKGSDELETKQRMIDQAQVIVSCSVSVGWKKPQGPTQRDSHLCTTLSTFLTKNKKKLFRSAGSHLSFSFRKFPLETFRPVP